MVARPSAISASTAGATCSGADGGEARQAGKIEERDWSMACTVRSDQARWTVRPPTSVRSDAADELEAHGRACSCPGSRAPAACTTQRRSRIEEADVGARARRRGARARCRGRARRDGDRASACAGAQARSRAPHLSVSGSSSSSAGGAGLGLAERHLLRVVVDRRVVRADRVDRCRRRAPRRSASRSRWLAQRRHEAAIAGRSRRCRARTGAGGGSPTSQVTGTPRAFASAHQRDALRRSRAAPGARARRSRAASSRMVRERDGLGDHRESAARPRRVATSPSCATPPRASAASCGRSQTGKPKVAAYCSALKQHVEVGERRVGLREGDAARLAQLGHLGEALALQPHGERAERIDARAVRAPARATLEHLHQPGLVERRIGVRRAGEAGHAAGDRGAAISDSSVALYSKPGSRRRAERSTRPGQTTRPVASMVPSARKPVGARRRRAAIVAVGDEDRRRARRWPRAGSISAAAV